MADATLFGRLASADILKTLQTFEGLAQVFLGQSWDGRVVAVEYLVEAASIRHAPCRLLRDIEDRSFPQRIDPGRPSIRMLSLRERCRDKMRYLFSTLTTPRAMDLRLVPLPGKLYFLYWFIVPVAEYVLRPLVRWLRNPRLAAVAADDDRRVGALMHQK
jgi:hypothetical protein